MTLTAWRALRATIASGEVEIGWAGRPVRIEHASGMRPTVRRAAALIVFLHEGPGVGLAMWKRLPAAPLRRRRLPRPGLFPARPTAARRRVRPDERWGNGLHAPAGARGVARAAVRCARTSMSAAQPPWLFGHSDGASITLLHAAHRPQHGGRRHRVGAAHPGRGLVGRRASPKRPPGLPSRPTSAASAWRSHHAEPDSAFWGWNDIWLDPAFRSLDHRRSELADDSLPAARGAGSWTTNTARSNRSAASPAACRRHASLELPDCGHSPHRDQPECPDHCSGRPISSAKPFAPTPEETSHEKTEACSASSSHCRPWPWRPPPLPMAQAPAKLKVGLMLPATGTFAALGTAIENGFPPAPGGAGRQATAAARWSSSRSTTSPTRPRRPTTSTN